MAIFSKHLDLGPPLKISTWRNAAIGTWRSAGDPSVYGTMEVDALPALAYLERVNQDAKTKVTFTHFVGKAMAQTIEKHPEINCILRFGRLYPRKTIDLFFLVATDPEGKDLSGTTVYEINKKSLIQIAEELTQNVHKIRKQDDPAFRRLKGLIALIPGFLIQLAVKLLGSFLYTFNIWTPLLGIPKDPFGTMMISSIGSIGMDMAFAPLVPWSKIPAILSVGMIREVPVVREGKIEIGKIALLCGTIDHRILDGVHASLLIKSLRKIFENPELELGPATAKS